MFVASRFNVRYITSACTYLYTTSARKIILSVLTCNISLASLRLCAIFQTPPIATQTRTFFLRYINIACSRIGLDKLEKKMQICGAKRYVNFACIELDKLEKKITKDYT